MQSKKSMNVEMDERVAEGQYANLVVISHSSSEFVLDFAATMPGLERARVKSRIVLTPEHAKRLLMSLQENITRYESNVARIVIPPHHLEAERPETPDTPEITAMSFAMGEA